MMLSEIIGLDDGDRSSAYYGVTVDVSNFTPPKNVKEVGLLYASEDGYLEDALMDVIIAYRLSDVNVILEIPCDTAVDAKYIMSIASNVGFSVSLLPPDKSAGKLGEYNERILSFWDAYAAQGNFGGALYPITSFFEYMHIESILGHAADIKPNDFYIKTQFIEKMDQSDVDAMKHVLKERIYAHFGGSDSFGEYVSCVTSKIRQHVDDSLKLGLERAGEAS